MKRDKVQKKMRGGIKEEWLPCFSGQGQCSGLSPTLCTTLSLLSWSTQTETISLCLNSSKNVSAFNGQFFSVNFKDRDTLLNA